MMQINKSVLVDFLLTLSSLTLAYSRRVSEFTLRAVDDDSANLNAIVAGRKHHEKALLLNSSHESGVGLGSDFDQHICHAFEGLPKSGVWPFSAKDRMFQGSFGDVYDPFKGGRNDKMSKIQWCTALCRRECGGSGCQHGCAQELEGKVVVKLVKNFPRKTTPANVISEAFDPTKYLGGCGVFESRGVVALAVPAGDPLAWIVMDRMAGDVTNIMKHGSIPAVTRVDVSVPDLFPSFMQQMLDQLACMHSRNQAHYDLKTPNVLYKGAYPNFVFQLADFGTMRTIGGTFQGLRHEMVQGIGIQAYPFALQKWDGSKYVNRDLDERSAVTAENDVFAMGLLLIHFFANIGGDGGKPLDRATLLGVPLSVICPEGPNGPPQLLAKKSGAVQLLDYAYPYHASVIRSMLACDENARITAADAASKLRQEVQFYRKIKGLDQVTKSNPMSNFARSVRRLWRVLATGSASATHSSPKCMDPSQAASPFTRIMTSATSDPMGEIVNICRACAASEKQRFCDGVRVV